MKVTKRKVRRWFNRHVHLRKGKMLQTVLPCTLAQRPTGALIMGNLPYPYQTSSIENVLAYREEIQQLLPPDSDFQLRMTCYLTDYITPEEVVRGFEEGFWDAVKLMRVDQKGEGGTTGSHHGVKNLLGRYPVFAAMQEAASRLKRPFPLLGHWEVPDEGVDEFDREIRSLEEDLIPLDREFPEMKKTVEHVTDGRVADFVAEGKRQIYATVTPHHLVINRNAMFRGGLNPINYCRPVAKREEHRLRIRKHVTSGNPFFGAGDDSAPHDEEGKTRCRGNCAGIFPGPHSVEWYVTVFDEEDASEEALDNFLGVNFLELYGMEPSEERVIFEKTPHTIPPKVGSVHVFRGGEESLWKQAA